MRGVHVVALPEEPFGIGSSPHARGPRVALFDLKRPVGIIPACAGSTQSYRRAGRGRRDHPRMRGVHGNFDDGFLVDVGSSPHARGPLWPG